MNRAMLVGVNRYQTFGNDLRGCMNDVEHIRALLIERCWFSVLGIRTLTNEQATKVRIMDSLRVMVEEAQEGDHLVFHFSGHGSQVPDIEGDEPEDAMDEILCPHNFGWTPDLYIRDDELREAIAPLNPGATLDVILDACHSGTGLRDVDAVARFIPYPGPMPRTIQPFSLDRGDCGLPNVALWAGCRSDQTSSDAFINNISQGAMTWAFVNSVRVLGVKATRRRILDRVVMKLDHKGYDQIPQLEASEMMTNKEVFT